MKKIDILTPIGLILGLISISFAIIYAAGLTGGLGFISFASGLTVFGGLIAALLVNHSMKDLKGSIQVVKQSFYQSEDQLEEEIPLFVELATKARREGLLALEQNIVEIDDPFVKKGIQLAIDGVEPELIKDILLAEITAMEERHNRGRMVVEKAGELAPAWGMIGTIIGLVLMLQTLNEPSTLGPKMALALITTFYGTILANLVFIPIAGKLANLSEEELFLKQIYIEGILGVQSGQNPRLLEEKLGAFLPPDNRAKPIKAEAQEGEGALVDKA